MGFIMQSIYKNDRRKIKHIGSKRFGIQYLLKGIYSHNGLLYFHLQLKNSSNVSFDVDYVTFKIVDKKVAKRIVIQEQVVYPLRAHNNVTVVDGTVFTLPKFTIPGDNEHHKIEAVFKAFAKSLCMAVKQTDNYKVPSTKGLL